MTVKKLNTKKEENVVITDGEVFNLLAGYEDEEGTVHTEFEVIEMTGAEEEAIAKPEIKANGAKIIRTILERCCVRIGTLTKKSLGSAKWREVIQKLFVGDQDYIMLKIREQSIGEEIEVSHDCPAPHCKAKLVTSINVNELEIIPFKGEREIEFELPRGYRDNKDVVHRTGKLRLPNGLDRELLDPIARKNIGEANTLMLTRCIVELDGVKAVTNEIVRSMSVKDREYLFNLLKDNSFGVSFESDITCDTCGTEFKATLNVVNFI